MESTTVVAYPSIEPNIMIFLFYFILCLWIDDTYRKIQTQQIGTI